MKISAVYIAKNEGKNIASSLESIKDAAGELILVDTGSTDNTVEIFKSFGGTVLHQKWQDDFSAPRNLALSKATGDWIIILDADESFSKETCNNIKSLLQSSPKQINGLLINMVNLDKDTGEVLDECYSLRIVRNLPKLNYKGRIHEKLYIGEQDFYGVQTVMKDKLSINHTGYSSSNYVEKNKRNLRMMKKAIEAGEPEEKYYTSLFESYFNLGDTENALHYAYLDINRGRQDTVYAARSYRGLLKHYASVNTQEGKMERLRLAGKAAEDFPELPDFHAEYSECLYQAGHIQQAKEELALAIKLFEHYDGVEPCLLRAEMVPLMKQRLELMSKEAAKSQNIKISACVIVKNEEKNILKWLENVKSFADEIIINDTGSEDLTKNLIADFSERNPAIPMVLIESNWQDDFSYAKNQCLTEATGEWLAFTDADELFSHPEQVREYIKEYADTDVQAVFVPMANIDVDDNRRVINIFNALRIFRKNDGIKYEGRIHENLTLNGQEITNYPTTNADERLYMEHTGYSAGINALKAKRNLNLLLKDVEEGQNVQRLYGYMAECYYTLEDYTKALENALLATQSDYQPLGHGGAMYWLALNAMEKLEYNVEERLAVVEAGIRLLPELPDFYGRKAMLEAERGKYHEASKIFALAQEKLHQYKDMDIHVESSNIMSVLHDFYADWGRCLYKTGRSAQAVEKYKEALQINPWTEKAICYWGDVYQGRCDKAFLQELNGIYEGQDNSQMILSAVFATNGFPELAEYFGGENCNNLLKIKSIDVIYDKSMKEIAELLPSLYVCLLEKYQEQYVKLLPENLQTIVRYIHGKPLGDGEQISHEAYMSFMKEVKAFGSPETIAKYVGIESHIKNDQEGKGNGH